tara:strand:+ start:674 stop:1489 length:816 start_codon:yes stop_codon:yes gene_type:complete
MPTFTGKTFSSFYKNILGLNQSGNTGVDATTRLIHDGAGQNTSTSLSDDVLSVQPVNDDTTGTMLVKNKGGSNILAVDTTNSKVLAGASQVAVNTQYAHFGSDNTNTTAFVADTYYALNFEASDTFGTGFLTLGSSTNASFGDLDPSTSTTIADTAYIDIVKYWYVMDDITVDRVIWWQGADAATGDSTKAYLMGYTVDVSADATGGDLSSGVKLASSSIVTNAGYQQAYYNQMSNHNPDVDAGKVILFAFASDTINSDYSINATIKYHIR